MATASVSSISALDTQLTAWATGGGDTVTEESVVTLDDGNYTTGLNVSGLSFPYRVWVQGRAPSTDGTSPVRVTGGIWNVSGTTNLGIRLIEFADEGERIVPNNSTNLHLDRCKIFGADVGDPSTTSYPDKYIIDPGAGGDQSGFTITNCLIGKCLSVAIRVREGTGQEISGCVFVDSGSDFIRLSEPDTDIDIDNNWFGKRMNPNEGDHCDGIQATVDAVCTGSMSGNVFWNGIMQRYSPIALQCIFIGDGGSFTGDVSDNIMVTDSAHGISLFSSFGSTVDNNLCCVTAEDLKNQPRIYITGADTGTRNFSVSNAGSTGLDGTNIRIDPGSPPDLTDIEPYYDTHPSMLGNIGQLTPIAAGGNHWDDSNPYGPALRLKAIINDGLHPGNVGWPVAETWTALYNNPEQDGTVIASDYTGSYNADGTNVTTPAAPVITGTPTINGTLTVGSTITFSPASVSGSPAPTRTWEVYNSVSGLVQDSAANSYVLQATDEGDQIYVIQVETNTTDPFTDTAQSANTGTIGAAVSPPTIVSRSPADGATGVELDSDPYTITFNKNITFGANGTIGLHRTDGTPTLRKTWDIIVDQGTGPNQVSISGATLSLTNGDLLLDNKDYWFEISSGAIEGTDGSVFGGINDSTTWNFSTSGTPASPVSTALSIGSAALILNGNTLII